MPTGEIAPQHVEPTEGHQIKNKDVSSHNISSPFNPPVSDKINISGIEVPDTFFWKGWEPGKEYIKNLVLKNVGIITQKLKYKVPNTRFFTTLYPKPIFLSSGASFTLPVTFRPLENIEYSDKVVFILKDGTEFEVQLRAVLPQMDISLPIDLDFKMCAVQDSIFIMFDVFNIGDLDTCLKWEVHEPFFIEPTEAEIKFNSSVKFRATFKPPAAFLYEVTAICRFGKDFELVGQTTFYGVGKFPHLLVSYPGEKVHTSSLDKMTMPEIEINFGKVAVGFTSELFIQVHNLSPVQTPFRVERIPGMIHLNTVFRCLKTRGVIPPMSFLQIPIVYSPHTVDLISIDYFSVSSVGNISHNIIKCIGTALGPNVELSLYYINFHQVDIGCSVVKSFEIINNSDVAAVYQFELDCEESVFKFSATSGTIQARSRETIFLQFVPYSPINFYRRVTFLIHNQPPLYINLLGTCHSDMVKPAILHKHHLLHYQIYVERGLSYIAPEQLNELEQDGRLQMDQNGCLDFIFAADKASLTRNPHPKDIPAVDEYFNDGFHSELINILPHVSLDVHVVDFGNVQNLNFPEERTVNITNHTRGKVTVNWMGDSSHVFFVNPVMLDIPPLKSCSFRVTFKAVSPNKLYGNELECFVSYKSMRDYKLVQDATHFPPWCLTLKCLGHTFMPNNQTYIPRVVMDPQVVVFPAVNIGENTHQTLLMYNQGDMPVLYDLTPSFSNQVEAKSKCGTTTHKNMFIVKPNKGLLRSGYQVFSVRLTPTAHHTYSHDMLLRLNDQEKYDQVVHLCGSAEVAEVVLGGEGNLYFKPTCAGTSCSRSYSFKNTSRIPLAFIWKVCKDDENVLKVEPSSGIVQPNESVSQTWTFIPLEQKKYVLKVTLVAWGQGLSSVSSGGKKRCFSLRVIGEGFYGRLQCDQTFLDFGDILVGSFASRPITIYNSSNCSLHYCLIIDGRDSPDKQDGSRRSTVGTDTTGVEFDTMKGEVAARGKQSITATVRPARRVQYQFTISYQLVTPFSKILHPAVSEPQHLIHLLATGVYPSMTVTDIRAQGSAIGISKKSLWNLFSLTDSTRHQSITNRPFLDFNFSAAPVGSDPCTVTIMFKNCRTVLCEWAFLFPKDIPAEMGSWNESGECTADELHEMKVVDNKLFDVAPMKGSLKPGETVSVTLSYLHIMAGTDHLPVLLKIARGREILLNFIGVTVEHTRPYIHFPSNKHAFSPIPIGDKVSHKQIYELYNGGAVPLMFEADLTPLDIIKKENFDQPIFECLTPQGEILPGQTVAMEWRFFPLEAKTYMVDVPIQVHNGDTAIITFTGVGYDHRVLGDAMSVTDRLSTTDVPGIQTASIPGQLGYLSEERISFGNVPLFSEARRMVFVTNKSTDRSIFFEWHVTSESDTQYLNIYPVRGKIGPNDIKMCRVTFLAIKVPAFYDLDLVCEISDLHEYTNYKRELAAWEVERDRQASEFTVMANDLHADMRTPDVVYLVGGPPSLRMLKLEALAEGRPFSSDLELSKYKTLPPIRQMTVDEQHEMERKQQKKLKRLWQKPQPQKPFMLHLGVTARTHDHLSFQTNFPDEFSHFHIDRSLSKGIDLLEPYQQEAGPLTLTSIECSAAESTIVANVLGNCLRSLLDDARFIEAAKKVMQEPIPYFSQIKDAERYSFAEVSTVNINFENLDSPRAEEETSASDEGDNQRSASVVSEVGLLGRTDRQSIVEDQRTAAQNMSLATVYHRDSECDRLDQEFEEHSENQALKRLPEFGHVAEQVLENSILNLMYEAITSDFSIVSKPRFIAMPRRKMSESSSTVQSQP